MPNITPLELVDRLQYALSRNRDRFDYASNRAVWPGKPGHLGPIPRTPLVERLREWYKDYEKYLEKHYADAINNCDSIIGKEWHFRQIGLRIPPPGGRSIDE